MLSKIVIGLFFVIFLFQTHHVYGTEELPIITIDFVSGNIIDLDESPQMVRAEIQIQNYNPQDGYHFMQVTRLSTGEIIKNTEIFPKVAGGDDDNLWKVQILHYIEPDETDETLIGDYELKIYSQYGPSENVSIFSVVKSSMPLIITENTIEELVTPDKPVTLEESITSKESIGSKELEKIPSWVHDIFVWYANETISENELLDALEYLIAQGTIIVNST